MLARILLIISFLWSFNLWAQTAQEWQRRGHIAEEKAQTEEAMRCYTAAYDLMAATKDLNLFLAGEDITKLLIKSQKVNEALQWADKIEIEVQKQGKDFYRFFALYPRYRAYSARQESEKAEALAKELEKILATASEDCPADLRLHCHFALSVEAQQKGIAPLTKQHFFAALALLQNGKATNKYIQAHLYAYGTLITLLGLYPEGDKALYMREQKRLAEAMGEEGNRVRERAYAFEAHLSTASGDTGLIKAKFEQWQQFVLKNFPENWTLLGETYSHTGSMYKDAWANIVGLGTPAHLEAVERARLCFWQALHYYKFAPPSKTRETVTSIVYRNLTFLLSETKLEKPVPFDTLALYGFEAFRYSLLTQSQQFTQEQFPDFSSPSIQSYNLSQSLYSLFSLQRVYLKQYEAGEHWRKPYLQRCIRASEQLIQRIRLASTNEADAATMQQTLNWGHHGTLYCYLAFYKVEKEAKYLDSIYHTIEQSSAALVRRHRNREALFAYAGVSKAETERYLQKRRDLQILSNQQAAAMRENRQSDAQRLNAEILRAQQQLKLLDEELAKKYPRYARTGFDMPSASIASIQQQMPTDGAFINFFNELSALVICKDTAFVINDIWVWGDHEKMQAFAKLLQQPSFEDAAKLAQEKKQFIELAVYQQERIRPLLAVLEQQKVHKLLISNNYRTGIGIYELMLRQAADTLAPYQDFDFLLKHYQVQYIPSVSLWLEAQEQAKGQQTNGKILAFSALYQPENSPLPYRSNAQQILRRSLSPLKGAGEEVLNLAKLYWGDFIQQDSAHEANFKRAMRQPYAVVHLAMHGLLDHETPEASALAFSEYADSTEDNFLYSSEIALLNLSAQLVVLSACETGVGQEQAGEGAMSLARYFLYAGTPAVVATRWQVNDQTTALIVQALYENLHKGLPASEALRQAQLTYLQHAKGVAQHPFFWAAFFSVGYTDTPIKIYDKDHPQRKIYYWAGGIGLGAIAALGGGLWWYRRRRKAAKRLSGA